MQRRRRMDQGLYLQDSPKTIENLLAKGWIEARGSDGDLTYRLTETGPEAKKASVRIS
jgi:hypothetical protein